LLARAYQLLRNSDKDVQDLRSAIVKALPHPDPRRHANSGCGDTRCGLHLDVVPQPLYARLDHEVDCTACLEAWIADRQKRVDEMLDALGLAKQRLHKVETGLDPQCSWVWPGMDGESWTACALPSGHDGRHKTRWDVESGNDTAGGRKWCKSHRCPTCENVVMGETES
jgi:hypothetical protein